MKNRNFEDMAADFEWIYRGADISINQSQYYVLTTESPWPEGRYGARWMRRFADIGDKFVSRPVVSIFNNGQSEPSIVDRPEDEITYSAYYPSWRPDEYARQNNLQSFGYGLTVSNENGTLAEQLDRGVVALEWRRGGVLVETYFFGYGMGLVGWRVGNTFNSVVQPEPASKRLQPETSSPRTKDAVNPEGVNIYNISYDVSGVAQPSQPDFEEPEWQEAVVTDSYVSGGVNFGTRIRPQRNTIQPEIGRVKNGDVISVDVNSVGEDWIGVQKGLITGYVGVGLGARFAYQLGQPSTGDNSQEIAEILGELAVVLQELEEFKDEISEELESALENINSLLTE